MAQACDLQDVFELNKTTFAEAWSLQALHHAMAQGYDLDVWYAAGGRLAAYYLGRDILDEVHIMQLAVAPAFRRMGLASRLTAHVIEKKRREGLHFIWLEVRASNIAAQKLYTGLGFRISGRRKNYYTPRSAGACREDPLVMRFDL